MVSYTRTERKIIQAMAEMDIIDCHEHLPPEKQRTDSPQDVFTLFAWRQNLFSAGMDWPAVNAMLNREIPLAERWGKVRPYWRALRLTSDARAALLAAKLVYGFDDINDFHRPFHPLLKLQLDRSSQYFHRRGDKRRLGRRARCCGTSAPVRPPSPCA